MTFSKKKIYIIAVVIVAAIIIAVAVWPEKTAYITAEVKKGKIIESISATGTVKPAKDIDLRFQTTGRVERITAEVGQAVKIGQELARLQLGDLISDYNEKTAALDVAKAQLDQIEEGSTPEEIQVAQTALDNAMANSLKEIAEDEQNLEDVKSKAESDLAEDYATARNYLNSSMQKIQEGLAEVKNVIDDTTVNSNLDQLARARASEKRMTADKAYENTKSYVSTANSTKDYNDIDKALSNVYESVNLASDAIEETYSVLLHTTVGGGLSQATLDAYKTDISTARTDINSARSNISDAIQNINSQLITNTKNINSAQNALNTTKTYWDAKIKAAQKDLDLKKAPARQSDIDFYKAKVRQAQAAVSKVSDSISKSILKSPIEGIVGSIDLTVGEITDLSQSAISVINNSKYQIETEITETDVGKVAIGNRALITYDAFPQKIPAEGKVIQIDPKGKLVNGVIYYKTTISLNENDALLRADLTANIDIINAERKNALSVPQRAIIEKDQKRFVKVLKSGQETEKEIKTGIMGNQGEVEIISGLQEDEQIIIGQE